MSYPPHALKSLEEANQVTAVRLTTKRRHAKVGDIFRLSPCNGVFLWGRLIKKYPFFGAHKDFYLVYIYDAISVEQPRAELLSPRNLIIGPAVVNNLGWVRGYWQIVASEPIRKDDILDQHLFVRFKGIGGPGNHTIVDEDGESVLKFDGDYHALPQSGFGNFNSVDWAIRGILESRGLLAGSAE